MFTGLGSLRIRPVRNVDLFPAHMDLELHTFFNSALGRRECFESLYEHFIPR